MSINFSIFKILYNSHLSLFILFEHSVYAVEEECRGRHRSCLSDKSAPPSYLHFPLFPPFSLHFRGVPFLFEQDMEFATFSFDIRSPAIRDFTSCFKCRDAAISRPTMPIPPFFFSSFSFFFPFFSLSLRVYGSQLCTMNDACKINLN